MFLALAQSVIGQEDYSFKFDIQQTVNGVVSGNLLSIGQTVIGEVKLHYSGLYWWDRN